MTESEVRAANPEWVWEDRVQDLGGGFSGLVGRLKGEDIPQMMIFHPSHDLHIDLTWPVRRVVIAGAKRALRKAWAWRLKQEKAA